VYIVFTNDVSASNAIERRLPGPGDSGNEGGGAEGGSDGGSD